MNETLWKKALAFKIDEKLSEYGFETRIAKEQFWTKNFTSRAILEYKKFMYLAAISEFMVSPSPIVDVVWHEHLTFTQSYNTICDVLGKQIQHVPSTHNRDDFDKFRLARDRTVKLYAEHFGEQPKDIWGYPGMFESMGLQKAKYNVRTSVIIGICLFIIMLVPAYFLLRPIYVRLNNPYFVIGLISLTPLAFAALEIYNRSVLSKIVGRMDRSSFLFDLQPAELVYAKKQNVTNVIIGSLNQLIVNKTINVKHKHFEITDELYVPVAVEEFQIVEALQRLGRLKYPELMSSLRDRPVFTNISSCMEAVNKYIVKSKNFGRLFYTNFGILAVVIMLACVRILTGFLRGKPTDDLVILLFVLMALVILYLRRLPGLVMTHTIPTFYKEKIIDTRTHASDWYWQYFLLGDVLLSAELSPVVQSSDHGAFGNSSDSWSGNSSDSSSGDSSCGSSCSSCGGCGGD